MSLDLSIGFNSDAYPQRSSRNREVDNLPLTDCEHPPTLAGLLCHPLEEAE
jgi:hypothetical protein